MTNHQQATSREEWNKARIELLEQEKAYSRQGDALAEARRALPWMPIDKSYEFDTSAGKKSLADLFAGRSQLLVYHFMFGPDWEVGCKSCSFWSDHFGGVIPHLAARDVTMLTVSRAPLAKLEAFKKRMGWTHEWVSSSGSDFNFDFGVSFTPEQIDSGCAVYNYKPKTMSGTELPGISAFAKDASGKLFHTYSAFGRGVETVNTTYRFLDLAPKGRDEEGLDFAQAWVRFKDEYGE